MTTLEGALPDTPLVVLDTAVVVRALTGSPEAASYRLLDAAGVGQVRPALSDRGLRELSRIVREEEERITGPARAFEIASALWTHAAIYRPARLEWPTIPDADDWWMLDLAHEAGADHIITFDTDLDDAPSLGFEVLTPAQLLDLL